MGKCQDVDAGNHVAVRLTELVMGCETSTTIDAEGNLPVGGFYSNLLPVTFYTDEDDDTSGIISSKLWAYFARVLPMVKGEICLDIQVSKVWFGGWTLKVGVFERFATPEEALARNEELRSLGADAVEVYGDVAFEGR